MNKIVKVLKSRWFIYFCLATVTLFILVFPRYARRLILLATNRTIVSVVNEYKKAVDARLAPHYKNAEIQYPGKKLIFLVNKDKLTLKLYAGVSFNNVSMIKNYPVLAESGLPGPKLKEGDCQIPEGIYKIESLNPNSSYHLSLKLNYPNEFDREMAARDERSNIGSNIFIHGKNVSIGCVAIGDTGIEELFALTHLVGKENIKVIIIPDDFKDKAKINSILKRSPKWTSELYGKLRRELNSFQ